MGTLSISNFHQEGHASLMHSTIGNRARINFGSNKVIKEVEEEEQNNIEDDDYAKMGLELSSSSGSDTGTKF